MSDAYNTVDKKSLGEYKDRGSKFIAYLFPISSESDFAEQLDLIKAEHFKARHHCTALRLQVGIDRSSDDGEPSGSAGKPMLNQLLSAELQDVGCVCVRYFGGTKLGVSGLIAAYKGAVVEAIGAAEIKVKYNTVIVKIQFDYAVMGSLMDCLKQMEVDIVSKDFVEKPLISLSVNESEKEIIISKIKARMLKRSLEDVKDGDKVEGVMFIE